MNEANINKIKHTILKETIVKIKQEILSTLTV